MHLGNDRDADGGPDETARRMAKAATISNMPMTMNQIPTRTVSTVMEVVGAATTTIPPIRLMAPNTPHQTAPSRDPVNAPMSAAIPCTIQVMPTSRPNSATVRLIWRIRTTPTTM